MWPFGSGIVTLCNPLKIHSILFSALSILLLKQSTEGLVFFFFVCVLGGCFYVIVFFSFKFSIWFWPHIPCWNSYFLSLTFYVFIVSNISVIVYWSNFMMASLKSFSQNSKICHLGFGIYWFSSFSLRSFWFLVLWVIFNGSLAILSIIRVWVLPNPSVVAVSLPLLKQEVGGEQCLITGGLGYKLSFPSRSPLISKARGLLVISGWRWEFQGPVRLPLIPALLGVAGAHVTDSTDTTVGVWLPNCWVVLKTLTVHQASQHHRDHAWCASLQPGEGGT